jgi:hypothetical protein
LDITPYTSANLACLGDEENWPDLVRILKPLEDFSVTTPEKLVYIDRTRTLFDAAFCEQTQQSIVALYTAGSVDSSYDSLKMLLAVGVDPDLPALAGHWSGWRPSHCCGYHGNWEAARCIFPCRPDMTALAELGNCSGSLAERARLDPLTASETSYQVYSFRVRRKKNRPRIDVGTTSGVKKVRTKKAAQNEFIFPRCPAKLVQYM